MITVFTQDNCQPCKQVKAWLDRHEIEFVERNVREDIEALEFIVSQNFNSTPVIQTDSDIWAGLNPTKMEALLH